MSPIPGEYDEGDLRYQIKILGFRVEALTKEKEEIERALEKEHEMRQLREKDFEDRIAKMEVSFQRGAGMMMVLPILGTIIGLLFAYGKTIFKPWTN